MPRNIPFRLRRKWSRCALRAIASGYKHSHVEDYHPSAAVGLCHGLAVEFNGLELLALERVLV